MYNINSRVSIKFMIFNPHQLYRKLKDLSTETGYYFYTCHYHLKKIRKIMNTKSTQKEQTINWNILKYIYQTYVVTKALIK